MDGPKPLSCLLELFLFSLLIFIFSNELGASIHLDSKKFSTVPKVRVRISKDINQMIVTGTDMRRMIYLKNDVRYFEGKKSVKLNCQNPGLTKKDNGKPLLLASFASKTGLLSLGEEKYQGKLYVLASSGQESCDVINEIGMEFYLESLLAKEMNGRWHLEALKAQAVAARTYALYKVLSNGPNENFFDLESSEKDQVSGTFFDVTANTNKATAQTRGEILITKGGNVTPIFYHAQCGGGKTLLPDQVWGTHVESYYSVPCIYSERENGKGNWSNKFPVKRLEDFLKWVSKISEVGDLKEKLAANKDPIIVAPDRLTNLRLRVYLGDKVYLIHKPYLRRFFGRELFPSNHFALNVGKTDVEISGVGQGHGVGMPQLGAKTMAELGWNYKQILNFYFPGHRLKKLY
jgi:stage II sporulation protein D